MERFPRYAGRASIPVRRVISASARRWISAGLLAVAVTARFAQADAPVPTAPGSDAATFFESEPIRGRRSWRAPDVPSAQLLRARDFDALEKKAAAWRKDKTRDEDGLWLLRRLYEGVSRPQVESDETYRTLIEHLDAWMRAKPSSVTARIASAEAWTGYAWLARGHGPAGADGRQDPRAAADRLAKAEELLHAAEALPEKCPELFAAWHAVAMGQRWPRERYDAMYAKAIATEPTYYDYYLSKAFALLPAQGGAAGEWQAYARSLATPPGSADGNALYARVVTHAWTRTGTNPFRSGDADWPLAKQGFDVLLARHPRSTWILNAYALFAYLAEDEAAAQPLVQRIGDSFVPAFWGTSEYYAKARTWAADSPRGHEWRARIQEANQAFGRRDFDAADQALRAAAKLADELPPNDPRHAETQVSFASLASLEGDYPKAREHMERAVTLYEQLGATDAPGFGKALSMLGFMRMATSDAPGAEEATRRAVVFWETHPGPEQQHELSQARTNLLQNLRAQGKAREAELEQAKLSGAAPSGPDADKVASEQHERASREAGAAGRLDDAEREARAALATWRGKPGATAEQARILGNLATAYVVHHQVDRALAIHGEIERLWIAAEGPKSPGIADELLQRAVILDQEKRTAEALAAAERALAIRRAAFGADDRRTSAALLAVASYQRGSGNPAQAEAALEETLARIDRPDQKDGMAVVGALRPLAMLYASQGRHAEAAAIFRRMLSLVQSDPLAPNRIYNEPTVCDELARELAAQGKNAEAGSYYRQAVESVESLQGANHLNLGTPLLEWARFLTDQGKHDEAETLLARAAGVFEAAGPGARPMLADALERRARSLEALGRTAEAKAAVDRAQSVRKAIATTGAPVL